DDIALTIDTARIERRDEPQAPASDDAPPRDDVGRARPTAPAAADGVAIATYPEWDHVLACERSDWTTIVETAPSPAPAAWSLSTPSANDDAVRRVQALAKTATIGRRLRQKRRSEGETLDIDACIAAHVARRACQPPDHRVYVRHVPGPRDLALLLLLDLSESTNDADGDGRTVLAAERAAAEVIAAAIDGAGDALAVHGFCSDGRHKVFYTQLKDFDEPFDLPVRARLAGLRAGFSTRLGAAMRHAGASLEARRAFRRVLLLLTDGEPADIDVFDPLYLVADARHVAQRLRQRGVDVFALGIGAGAHLARIVGPHAVLQVPSIAALPARLLQLYTRLKR
ncbi:MAG TPA: VWA domain-containing protein, partial [Vineibacter terrae]